MSSSVAYFTTAYPSVSHTFIRREICALEDRGLSIARLALRPGEGLIDADDREELGRTSFIVAQPISRIILETARGLVFVGPRLLRGVATAWRLSCASERGLLRHGAYLVEALMLVARSRSSGFTHVHVHFGTNSAAVAVLAKLMGGPSFSMTVHGPDEFDAPIGLSLGLKIRESVFTAAISSYGAAQLRRWVHPSVWPRIHIVRCIVDEAWFDHAAPVPDDADTLVCVGRLSEQKGQVLLVDALADAVAQGFAGRLILVGDGPLRPEIEARVARHGLGDRVEITGWQGADAIRRHLLSARALVLPSFAEGLPVVIMEAMAMQRPVLTTTIMGIPELVEHGENGWLMTAGEQAEIVRGLLEIQATPVPTLRRMGQAASHRVAGMHTAPVQIPALAALLAEAG